MSGFVEMPKRRATSSIAQLSQDGRELVEAGLADGRTYAEIIADLDATTGEKVSRSALSRWRITDFEPTRRRIEAAKSAATELAGLLSDTTAVEEKFTATAQGLFNTLLPRILEAKGEDLPKMLREARLFQTARNQLRRLENDEQRVKLETEQLELRRRELDKKLADFETRQAKLRETAGGIAAESGLSEEAQQRFLRELGLDG